MHGRVTVSFADDRTATLFMDALATGGLEGDYGFRIIAATTVDQQPANFYEIGLNEAAVSDWFDSLTGTTATLNYADIQLQNALVRLPRQAARLRALRIGCG